MGCEVLRSPTPTSYDELPSLPPPEDRNMPNEKAEIYAAKYCAPRKVKKLNVASYKFRPLIRSADLKAIIIFTLAVWSSLSSPRGLGVSFDKFCWL